MIIFSMCFFATHLSSLVKCPFKSFAHFLKIRLFVFLFTVKLHEFFIYSGYEFFITGFVNHMFCKYVFIVCGLPFHFLNSIFQRLKLNIDEIQVTGLFFLFFSFIVNALYILSKESSLNLRSLIHS